jgi:hypothetical protein
MSEPNTHRTLKQSLATDSVDEDIETVYAVGLLNNQIQR